MKETEFPNLRIPLWVIREELSFRPVSWKDIEFGDIPWWFGLPDQVLRETGATILKAREKSQEKLLLEKALAAEELGEPTIFMQGTLLPDGNGDIQFGAVRVTTQRHEVFPKE